MPAYRTSKPYLNELIRIAHKWIDDGIVSTPSDMKADAEQLLELAHKIGSESLAVNFPAGNLLGSLIALLQDQNIQFALIGAVAVSVHGLVRQTEDIDALVSNLPDMHDSEYATRFGFYRAKSHTGTIMTIDHKQEGYVELLVANSALSQYALQTAKPQSILGFSVPVIEPDAIIATKCHALTNNPKREQKDTIDILAVYKQNKPDLSAVRKLLSDAENQKLNEIIK